MTTKTGKYPVHLMVKIDYRLERELRRRADADHRPLAAFIRHTLLRAVEQKSEELVGDSARG